MAKSRRAFFKPLIINVSSVLGYLAQLIALLMTETLNGVVSHGRVSTGEEFLDSEYVNDELGTHAHG